MKQFLEDANNLEEFGFDWFKIEEEDTFEKTTLTMSSVISDEAQAYTQSVSNFLG